MNTCKRFPEAERFFDGIEVRNSDISEHVSNCPECGAYVARLDAIRSAVAGGLAKGEIADGQFNAFMSGVRGRIETDPKSQRSFWAASSLVAASLLMAVSAFVIISGGAPEAQARTEVQFVETDLEGATTSVTYSEQGSATVWLNVPDGEMW